ncbi:MAG: transporter [Deltaproteobacteria bacterium]|nr:transporter [Deltaproteobacteria bacterium]
MKKIFLAVLIGIFFAVPVFAQDEAELAKMLSNPIASLIMVPIQADYDQNFGPDDEGSVWRINIQPVIPFTLNEEWNLISRTILPVIDQDDIPVKGMGEFGIGDVVQSLFLSPQKPSSGGVIWGVGPVFLLPTASDVALGGEKWGIGPTAVALKQTGPWTYGMLTNHIESFTGDDYRADVSMTMLQPFLTYRTKTMTTFSLEIQSTFDWENEQWSVPINFSVQQLLKIGKMPLQIGAGVRYWADSPDTGAEGWGTRLTMTFLFPKIGGK